MLRILFIFIKELYLRLKQNSLAIKMATILTDIFFDNKLKFNNLDLLCCAKILERERERERERETQLANTLVIKIFQAEFSAFFLACVLKTRTLSFLNISPINTSIVVSVNTFVSPIYFVVVISDQHESSVYPCHNYVRQLRVEITRSCYLFFHFQATNIN